MSLIALEKALHYVTTKPAVFKGEAVTEGVLMPQLQGNQDKRVSSAHLEV